MKAHKNKLLSLGLLSRIVVIVKIYGKAPQYYNDTLLLQTYLAIPLALCFN